VSDPRALLDTYAAELWVTTLSERPLEEFAPKAFAALRAVLDLHRPVHDERTGWDSQAGGYGTISPACESCGSNDLAVAWPCPTMQAITTALETK
jgi:hypothetical protein